MQEYARAQRTIVTKIDQLYIELCALHEMIPLYKEGVVQYQKSLEVAGNAPSLEIIYMLDFHTVDQNIFNLQVLLFDAYVRIRDNIRWLEALTGIQICMENNQLECAQQDVVSHALTPVSQVTVLAGITP